MKKSFLFYREKDFEVDFKEFYRLTRVYLTGGSINVVL